MSDGDNVEICPKCGYKNTNPHVCDACGVILDRLRGRRVPDPDSPEASVSDLHNNIYRPAYGHTEPVGSGARNVLLVAFVVGLFVGLGGWFIYQRMAGSFDGLIRQHRAVVAETLKIMASPDSSEEKSRALDKCVNRTAGLTEKLLKRGKMNTLIEIQKVTYLLAANEMLRRELDAIGDALDANEAVPSTPPPMERVTALLDVAESPASLTAMERVTAVMRPVAPDAARTMDRSQKLFDQRADDVREAEEFSATPQDREQAVQDFDRRFGKSTASPGSPQAARTPTPANAGGDDQKIIEAARRDARRFIDNVGKNPFADVKTSAPVKLYP